MISTKVARRYGKALFSTASQLKVIDVVERDLLFIVDLLHTHLSFRHFLYNPSISFSKKFSLIQNVFKDKIHSVTFHVLGLLLEKRRIVELKGICHEFIALRRRREHIAFAEITSAHPLSTADRTKLIKKLESKLGKKVEPEFHVNPKLIAGIKVSCENFIWNSTLEDAIKRLRESTLYYSLKQA